MSYENDGLGTGQNQTAKLENLLTTLSLQHGQVRQKGRDQIRFIGAQMLFMNNLDFSSKIDVFVWFSETIRGDFLSGFTFFDAFLIPVSLYLYINKSLL